MKGELARAGYELQECLVTEEQERVLALALGIVKAEMAEVWMA